MYICKEESKMVYEIWDLLKWHNPTPENKNQLMLDTTYQVSWPAWLCQSQNWWRIYRSHYSVWSRWSQRWYRSQNLRLWLYQSHNQQNETLIRCMWWELQSPTEMSKTDVWIKSFKPKYDLIVSTCISIHVPHETSLEILMKSKWGESWL